jgi:hypothetical protein
MELLIENRKKQTQADLLMLNSNNMSKMGSSDLNDTKTVPPRAKTALTRVRRAASTSQYNESLIDLEEDEEEEELQRRLEEYESMLRRAEYMR